jgi:hypothetical protein
MLALNENQLRMLSATMLLIGKVQTSSRKYSRAISQSERKQGNSAASLQISIIKM